MASLIGHAMVRHRWGLDGHLPVELYKKIMSYLLPKYLLNTPEIKLYNKVVTDIPGFDVDITPKRIFSSAAKSFRTVKFIYRLKMEWKNTRAMAPPNTIIVHLPFLPGVNHQEQYHIYHLLQDSPYQREKRTKRDLYKAKYGEKG